MGPSNGLSDWSFVPDYAGGCARQEASISKQSGYESSVQQLVHMGDAAIEGRVRRKVRAEGVLRSPGALKAEEQADSRLGIEAGAAGQAHAEKVGVQLLLA
jgi:hypothetical protein